MSYFIAHHTLKRHRDGNHIFVMTDRLRGRSKNRYSVQLKDLRQAMDLIIFSIF